jgi:hypothetical protein
MAQKVRTADIPAVMARDRERLVREYSYNESMPENIGWYNRSPIPLKTIPSARKKAESKVTCSFLLIIKYPRKFQTHP